MVFESVDQISNAKNLEDKYQIQINNINLFNKTLLSEKAETD